MSSPSKSHLVFVYGTLKRGEPNETWMTDGDDGEGNGEGEGEGEEGGGGGILVATGMTVNRQKRNKDRVCSKTCDENNKEKTQKMPNFVSTATGTTTRVL